MNKDRPVSPISTVIPCYRCASTIGRAVDSVFAQSVNPVEVILVEDCSGDDTLAVLSELERVYLGRIKVVRMKENLGVASARNAGWAIATQPYIAFLDADDSWHPDKLCIQHEYMRNNPDIALCGHQCVWLRDSENPPAPPKIPRLTKIGAGNLLLKNAFSTPSVMLKRDIPFRFQEGKRCAEDLLLWQQIAFSGLQVARIESPLAYVYKPLYGVGGLSAQLWKMEKGELSNFVSLYKAGYINWLLFIAATVFSISKYSRRLLVTRINQATRFVAPKK